MNSTSAGSGGPPRGPQFDNRRIAAGLIDVVTVVAIALVVGFVAGSIAGPDKKLGNAMPVLVLAWALFYYFALESGNGQTLGKRIMGLRVLTVDGRHANMGEIGVRTVLRIIDGIGLYLVGLITMIATGQRRQRLGDLAAKTIVISADWKPAAAGQTTASAAASPANSAIVLPTPEPAGPEMPAAAVPSPFTPLATEPTPEPAPTVTAEPPSAEPEPPTMTSEPSSVTLDEPVVAEEPSFVTPEPPSVTLDEPVVAEESPVETAPAEDVAPAKDPIVDGPADGTWEALPAPTAETPVSEPAISEPLVSVDRSTADEVPGDHMDEPDEDEPVKVRSVETMSAMDMLMAELEEDEPAGQRPAS